MYAFSQFFVLSFTRLVTCKSEWSVFHSHDLDADVMRQFDQIIIELHGLLDSEEPPTDNAGYFDEARWERKGERKREGEGKWGWRREGGRD